MLRFLDLGDAPGDDADLRARKRTAVATMAAVIVASVVYGFVGAAAGRPATAIFAMLQAAVIVGLLVYLRRTRRVEPTVAPMIISGLLVIASGVITLGGPIAAGTNLAWALSHRSARSCCSVPARPVRPSSRSSCSWSAASPSTRS